MHDELQPRRKFTLVLLLILVPILFLLGWSQASLNLSFLQPASARATILLIAISVVIFLAFVIFALILTRILLKLYFERSKQQFGAHFKIKMLAAFLGLSVVPVCVLFIFANGLLNRSIDKWFGIPFDTVRRDASEIFHQVEAQAEQRTLHDTVHLAEHEELQRDLAAGSRARVEAVLARTARDLSLDLALCFDAHGEILAQTGQMGPDPAEVGRLFSQMMNGRLPESGASTRWAGGNLELFLAASPVLGQEGEHLGSVVIGRQLPTNIRKMAGEIQREAGKYDELSRERRAVKRIYLWILSLLTLLILFAATWFALFLSKQVTVPIGALAEATHEVSRGNLGYRVTVRSGDELGSLIESFNEMTSQLEANRRVIEQAAKDLREAHLELEEHARLVEVILQNIPTGVVSLDRQGQITQVNSTMERMFGAEKVKNARSLGELLVPDDLREVSRLFRRAARQGSITRQMDLEMNGRRVPIALTISSIRAPRGTVGGMLLVIEDLTEVLRAQKAMAWQEVAQRIAHEIKNPLTPIQLSTDRIRRLIERAGSVAVSQDLADAVSESVTLVGREIESLKQLVDEFSSLARFPASRPVPAQINHIVEAAFHVFEGRLDGVSLQCDLARDLPPVQADPEQLRRAIVNLIDNAAEAVEKSALRVISVRTALDAERDIVELIVADSGPGITAEAKEKLFLPFFSTKRRGTGLGLAIVSRIVSEHNGTIRVEENQPSGTRFVIELAVDRAAVLNAG
ncbi:MAG: PAS domain-containing protein [Acidobacteria bacterium]|nr:PAS domain-containing protein [Acidobacteriota bacterium]